MRRSSGSLPSATSSGEKGNSANMQGIDFINAEEIGCFSLNEEGKPQHPHTAQLRYYVQSQNPVKYDLKKDFERFVRKEKEKEKQRNDSCCKFNEDLLDWIRKNPTAFQVQEHEGLR